MGLTICEQCDLWLHDLQVICLFPGEGNQISQRLSSRTHAMACDRKPSTTPMTELRRRAETLVGQW
jgi:hypothetical protein